MNKVIIIGNGFDLAHGLPTGYSHFVVWYFNQIADELALGKDYKDPLIEIITTINLTKNVIRSPSDIKIFFQKLESIKEINFKVKSQFFNRVIKNLFKLNWVDIEAAFYQQLVRYFHIYNKQLDENPISEYVKELNNELQFLHGLLIQYLRSTVIFDKSIINEEILLKLKHELKNDNDLSNSVQFIIFNYTNTIDYYLSEFSNLFPDVNYIHGKLSSLENPTIFGYGDEMDTNFREIELLNNNLFLENMKSFNYHISNNYKKMLGFLSNGYYKVILMGHSCGLSDRILLNKIFEHEKCHSIKVYYHKKNEVENDYKEKMFEIYRHFSADSKSLMLERMISFDMSQPLIDT